MARTGRRPGVSGTREAILDAARRAFAEQGYQQATIRGVAELWSAGLVRHYFGTKQDLFIAAVQLPINPVPQLMAVLADDPGGPASGSSRSSCRSGTTPPRTAAAGPDPLGGRGRAGPRPYCASSSRGDPRPAGPFRSAAPTPACAPPWSAPS